MCNRNRATVFVVDDDPAVRRSMQRLLETVPHPVVTYACAEEYLEEYDPEQPGCLVADVRMPGMNGIELHERLLAEGRTIPVILVTGHGDVSMAVSAMQRGAMDFIEKPFRPQMLLDRIADALAQDAKDRRERANRESAVRRIESLTPREHEVLRWVVKGKPNKQIAAILGICHKTVENHRARIMQKTGAGSLPELVRLALLANESDDCSPRNPQVPATVTP